MTGTNADKNVQFLSANAPSKIVACYATGKNTVCIRMLPKGNAYEHENNLKAMRRRSFVKFIEREDYVIMIGAIIGDIVGSRFEWNNHRSKDFELFTPACTPTDDSIMIPPAAAATSSSLLTANCVS